MVIFLIYLCNRCCFLPPFSITVKFAVTGIEYDEEDKPSKPNGGMSKNQTESEFVPGKDLSQSPLSEDMEESSRNKSKTSYFAKPAYGPVQPSGLPQEWQGTVS